MLAVVGPDAARGQGPGQGLIEAQGRLMPPDKVRRGRARAPGAPRQGPGHSEKRALPHGHGDQAGRRIRTSRTVPVDELITRLWVMT